MIEVLRTNDPVLISYVQAVLKEQEIDSVVMDTNASILDGSVGAIPRRLMIIQEDAAQARLLLVESEAAPSLNKNFSEGNW